jgi:hypothetical protein
MRVLFITTLFTVIFLIFLAMMILITREFVGNSLLITTYYLVRRIVNEA